VKRGRRVGERRARRLREHAVTRQAEADEEDNVLQRFADLDASVAAELATAPEPPDAALDGEFQGRLEAAIAKFDKQLTAQLDTKREYLRDGATVLHRFFENAERVADRDAAAADAALQQVVERLRARQLSKKQLAVLARVIAAQLGQAELAIRDAKAACESAGRDVEGWTRSVAIAVRHGRDDLAEAARGRVERSRSNVKLTDTALREYLELRDGLRHLGRVLLEIAEGSFTS